MASRKTIRAVPDTPPRAVLYLRQSTYREESISLELQETAGRDYCARQGYDVLDVVADPGISGRTFKRKGVTKVMDMIEDARADVIVLWKWSRLSRNRRDWALAADRVEVAGGRIESATEQVDVATSVGRLARGVLTEFAAFESERIGEQWTEVWERRAKLGLPVIGRVPWGWMLVEQPADRPNSRGPMIPVQHPEHGPVVVSLYRRYLAGEGFASLARWLNSKGYRPERGNAWYATSVLRLLDSPTHAGYVPYRGDVYPGQHEGLISEEVWQQYQAVRRTRHVGREQRSQYLMSGMLRCVCGSVMVGHHTRTTDGKMKARGSTKRYDYYGYRCDRASSTPNHGPREVSQRYVDGAVLDWMREIAADVDGAAASAPEPAVELSAKLDVQRISRQVTVLDKQLVMLTRQLAAEVVPEAAYREARAEIEEQKSVLLPELQAAEDRLLLTPAVPVQYVRDLLEEWDTLPLVQRRAMLRNLIRKVVVTPGRAWSVRVLPTWEGQPEA